MTPTAATPRSPRSLPVDRSALPVAFLRELLLAPNGPLSRVEVVESVDSTNSALRRELAAEPGAWPAPALLLAEFQTSGRGRQARRWEAPAGSALLGSAVVRPGVPRERWGWLPLLAGLATVRAVRATAGLAAVAKWPNDVLVPAVGEAGDVTGWGRYRKVAGLLAEVVDEQNVILGMGLNVTQGATELPVPSATSLLLAGGATTDRVVLVTATLEALGEVLDRWRVAAGDAERAGLAAEYTEVSATLGARVTVAEGIAGAVGRPLEGLAEGLSADGGLLIRTDDGEVREIRSGDVHGVRVLD